MVSATSSYKTGPLDMAIVITNPPNSPALLHTFEIILGLLGLAFIAGAIFMHRRNRRLGKTARVQGEIVDVKREFTGKSKAYFPVVAFRTRGGADIQTLVLQGKIFSPPQVGTQVTIIYDPAKPATAYIYSPGFRYAWIVYIAAGLGLLGLSIMAFVAPN